MKHLIIAFIIALHGALCVVDVVNPSGISTYSEYVVALDKNETNVPSIDSDEGKLSHDTKLSFRAHVSFSSIYEDKVMKQEGETYLNRALMLTFAKMNMTSSIDLTVNNESHVLDVKITSQKITPFKNKKEDSSGGVQHRYLRRYKFYRLYDYSILFDFGCGNLCGDKSGFWDRRFLEQLPTLNKGDGVYTKEFCKHLRASSSKTLKTATNCQVRFQ